MCNFCRVQYLNEPMLFYSCQNRMLSMFLSNFEKAHDLLKKDVDEDDQLVFVRDGLCFKCQIMLKKIEEGTNE